MATEFVWVVSQRTRDEIEGYAICRTKEGARVKAKELMLGCDELTHSFWSDAERWKVVSKTGEETSVSIEKVVLHD